MKASEYQVRFCEIIAFDTGIDPGAPLLMEMRHLPTHTDQHASDVEGSRCPRWIPQATTELDPGRRVQAHRRVRQCYDDQHRQRAAPLHPRDLARALGQALEGP